MISLHHALVESHTSKYIQSAQIPLDGYLQNNYNEKTQIWVSREGGSVGEIWRIG